MIRLVDCSTCRILPPIWGGCDTLVIRPYEVCFAEMRVASCFDMCPTIALFLGQRRSLATASTLRRLRSAPPYSDEPLRSLPFGIGGIEYHVFTPQDTVRRE